MFEKISIVEMIKIAQTTDSDPALDSQMELL
jgi:hypothetical protein